MTASELRALDTFPLVEVVNFGTREQTFAPGVTEDGSMVFDTGESILWEAKTIIHGWIAIDGKNFRKVWDPGTVQVIVTDRRIMYWQSKFDHGRNNTFGIVNIAFSTYSKWRAAKRRKGRVAAGHLRYENLRQLFAKTGHAGLIGPVGLTLAFDVAGSGPGIVRVDALLKNTESGFEDRLARMASLVAGRDIPLLHG